MRTRGWAGQPRRSPRCPRRTSPSRSSGSSGGDHPGGRQGGAARATPPAAARSRSSTSPTGRWSRTRSRRLADAGVDARDRRVRRRPGRRCSPRRSPTSGPRSSAPRSPSGSAAAAGSSSPPRQRQEQGDVFALNGDELVDVDFGALLAEHRETGAAATDHGRQAALAVRRRRAGRRRRRSRASSEGGRIPYWVSCGVYVLSPAAVERLPDLGDHESTTFPELAAEGKLRAFRHEGAVVDGEHAEGAAPRAGARGRTSRMATGVGSAAAVNSSPNLTGVDRFAFDPRRSRSPGAPS